MDVAAFLLALVPIIWLVVMLLCFKWPAWKAAIGSFVLSCLLAFAWWHLPAAQIATASLEGFLMALWPIVLVIIAAVFTYNLCVRTGAMDVIGSMITSISSDRRLLALLVAWCFGGFMEGMAGFGTAVAIPAGMLAGLGFEAVPAVLICLLANGVALLSGVSFVGAALVVAMFVGPELAVVVGSIVSLALTAALAMRAEKSGHLDARFHMNIEAGEQLTVKSALSAWSCFILIFVLLLGTSNLVPAVHAALAPFASHVQVYCGENPGMLTFSWINTPGVWIFLAAFVGGAIQGASPRMMGEVLAATVKQMTPTVITMLSVLGCAKVMGYAGMISSISAFCIAVAGGLYPILAPWIGAVGAFVTGSGTSSGMLFGPIQSQAATALGVSDYWMVALNALGVAAGKMISPQTLAIGLAAVHVRGKDAELLGAVLPYAAGMLVLMSAIAMLGQGLPL